MEYRENVRPLGWRGIVLRPLGPNRRAAMKRASCQISVQTIAAELGLAPGSIGFIRQRCLDRLCKHLKGAGFP